MLHSSSWGQQTSCRIGPGEKLLHCGDAEHTALLQTQRGVLPAQGTAVYLLQDGSEDFLRLLAQQADLPDQPPIPHTPDKLANPGALPVVLADAHGSGKPLQK